MRIPLSAILVAFLGAFSTAPAAPSDNPSAGLNLGDASQPTGFAAQFSDHLVSLQDGRAKTFDASTLQGVKYFAFYYSASWCPPCRKFTPLLVQFYNEFKANHPNFELIFVDHDDNEDAMLQYMKTDAMPWPAVRFEDISRPRIKANQYCGSGIPDLVLVDASGKILSNSFDGNQYTGPYHVLDDIKKLVTNP